MEECVKTMTESVLNLRVISTSVEATVAEAARIMRGHNVSCLVVNDPDGKIIGVITERDIVSLFAVRPADSHAALVGEIMSDHVISVLPGTPMIEAEKIMANAHVRHLPVVLDDVAVGMVSSRDAIESQMRADRSMKAAAEQVALLSTCLRSLDFDDVVNMITREVPRMFSASQAVLCLTGMETSSASGTLIRRNECVCQQRKMQSDEWCQRLKGKTHIFSEDASQVCCEANCSGAMLKIPLNMAGLDNHAHVHEVGGWVCMCGLDFSADDARELIDYKGRLVGEILNVNLANAKRYQMIRESSMTDSLTGVGTRRLFDEKIEDECIRSRRSNRPFCVAMIDVDNFKRVNDEIGHGGGDQALVGLAKISLEIIRVGDVLARYGGDEFVLLLPETCLADAMAVLDRIRCKFESSDQIMDRPITVSAGVVEQPGDAPASPTELVHRADLALYRAKQIGKNRIETWQKAMEHPQQASLLETERIQSLEKQITQMSTQSKDMFVQSIWGLVHAIEARDAYTRNHSENVMRYAVVIAETMQIDSQEIEVIRRAAMIHDVGKIGIPDAILNKPGKLTPEERAIMEQHSLIGANILGQMRFLEREMPIVRHHHERYDGLGYPDGISGSQIPFGARILAVADAFDAISSDRIYHKGRSPDETIEMLLSSRGTQLDGDPVDAMASWIDGMRGEMNTAELTASQLLEATGSVVIS